MVFAWCSAVLKLGQHLQAQRGDIGIILSLLKPREGKEHA